MGMREAGGESTREPLLATVGRGLTRRVVVRSLAVGATLGVAGLSGVGRRLPGALAATPEAEADPEAEEQVTPEPDPEADEGVTPEAVPEGSPVGSAGEATIYSGRNENLVGSLIARFEAETGIDLKVRYGQTADLAITILDEGKNSPASLFFSQDAGDLGALADAGRLQKLPDELLNRVPTRFRSKDGLWVGTSARARVAAYNTNELKETDLPASVLDFTDSKWKGKLGWAPANASFQAFITAFRVLKGEDAARGWLKAMLKNEPKVFQSNGPIVEAIGNGELQAGLVNHYYIYELKQEKGQDFPVANHFFAAGDVGSLVNVAGVGVLSDADDADKALKFVDYLLEREAQTYFADKTFEYPLIQGVATRPGLKPLSEIQSPDIDLSDLSDLKGTLELLNDLGVL